MLDKLPIEIAKRISEYLDSAQSKIDIVKTRNDFNIKVGYDLIVNLEIVNNIRRINKFHEIVNKSLNKEGIYLSCAETLEERRVRVRSKTFFGFKNIVRVIDFIYKRVIPKLPILKNIYFNLTGGNNRVISKSEILGRLISCGFGVIEYFEHDNLLYIISKKIKEPDYNMKASYGPLFKMNRVGYKGKIIGVYKLRTMYPYSEYCQDMIIKENKLASSGKILNDFRVTTWGKLFRKFWIDELPMFINFFKLELNLVGVRPLSKNYFMKYPQDLRELRIKFKPGLIPPYYADLPKNFEQILDSERKYLESKVSSPIMTDVKYFFRAIINIIFKGARSS
tara:strand:- start:118 stop:1128 length:1011 start_codon:yes stop_codon:yes gene_type:complete